MKLEYDPNKVGLLELGWWRAHNDKNKPEMARLLIEQNAALYGFTLEEAKMALASLVGGVSYHDTREWDKAVDSVVGYFDAIKQKTRLGFDSRRMAELEVGWWQLHDKLEFNPDKTELAHSFALLFATQFGIEPLKLAMAGKMRAEATREHDLAEDPNTPNDQTELHWEKAGENLVSFYKELKAVVNE